MPSGNWSFPCSPRNPAKVREELRLLASLLPGWRERQVPWSPRSGAQLEFGRHLRLMNEFPASTNHPATSPATAPRSVGEPAGLESGGSSGGTGSAEAPPGPRALPGQDGPEARDDELRFQTQASSISQDNLRWTARARFGTYKFFGFVSVGQEGYAQLTPAGAQFIQSSRPGDILLRQLLKWQYPDNQHRGSRWPAEDYAIFPFVATARLIRELAGLTRREIALFCFTMRRTEEAAATAEAIRQFRERQTRATGRTGKARSLQGVVAAAQARYAAEGRRVVLQSTDDYADALIRYFRYTGLFSVRGARIVVASGREEELDELIFTPPLLALTAPRGRLGPSFPGSPVSPISPRGQHASSPDASSDQTPAPAPAPAAIQLSLGEAPPLRMAAPLPLFPGYTDAAAFYAHYGSGNQPRLPWEDAARLQIIARTLDRQVADLNGRHAHLKSGRTVLDGQTLGAHLPDDYEALVALVDGLRRRKRSLEEAVYALESRTPARLAEALEAFTPILRREVIDPPTFLEWNTWRVFLALNHAHNIIPHLMMDDDLQPLSVAQGNQPDLEVVFDHYVLVVEVTLRSGADQRQAEARPVTRHILEVQRRHSGAPASASPSTVKGLDGGAAGGGAAGGGAAGARRVYGLFLAPRMHPDTATDFFVALKYRVIERQQIAAIPLTISQFTALLQPFAGQTSFDPALFEGLLSRFVQAGLGAETGDEWLVAIRAELRRWLASYGAAMPATDLRMASLPLPLFTAL